jgi:hypothetical protein
MVRLTALDEGLVHQLPEPLPNVVIRHDHWRESYFFIAHQRSGPGDVIILTMATYPQRETLDSLQMGQIDGSYIFARHERAYGDDPHTTIVGPVQIDIVEPYKTVRLHVDKDAPVSLDLTFTARTRAYGLRRGTMKRGDEIIWDQSHMIQSGFYNGSYTKDGVTRIVDGWWGQRDHSWGIRDHARCPLWMWFQVQFEDGTLGVWHWEYANGARVYTDGCFAPADGREPIPVVDFRHDEMHWTDKSGNPADYGKFGENTAGLAGRCAFTLEGGKTIVIDAEGTRCAPYGPLGGGLHQMVVRADDGRVGTAIFEVTGAFHHQYFPVARGERLPPG